MQILEGNLTPSHDNWTTFLITSASVPGRNGQERRDCTDDTAHRKTSDHCTRNVREFVDVYYNAERFFERAVNLFLYGDSRSG